MSYTKSRKQARRLALELERQVERGEGATAPPTLLADVIDEYMTYLRGLGRANKTIGKYRHCFKLVQELAVERQITRLDGIDHRFADAFRNRRAEKRAPKTVLNDLVLIRQLINFAIRRNLLREDPLKALELGKAASAPQPFWTKEQVDRIVAATSPHYRPYFEFLAETGARCGEAIWFTWEDVDFENGVLHIRAKEGWRPKTGDERVIPMSQALREVLTAQSRVARWVFTAAPSMKQSISGRQIDARRALAHLKTVLRRQGLTGHQHTFRHSFISHALTSGVPEAIVRKWVGHVDDRIIQRYTHIADQISRDAMRQLGRSTDERRATG